MGGTVGRRGNMRGRPRGTLGLGRMPLAPTPLPSPRPGCAPSLKDPVTLSNSESFGLSLHAPPSPLPHASTSPSASRSLSPLATPSSFSSSPPLLSAPTTRALPSPASSPRRPLDARPLRSCLASWPSPPNGSPTRLLGPTPADLAPGALSVCHAPPRPRGEGYAPTPRPRPAPPTRRLAPRPRKKRKRRSPSKAG